MKRIKDFFIRSDEEVEQLDYHIGVRDGLCIAAIILILFYMVFLLTSCSTPTPVVHDPEPTWGGVDGVVGIEELPDYELTVDSSSYTTLWSAPFEIVAEQYSIWQYESWDSLLMQCYTVWEHWDYWRTEPHVQWALNNYYRELGEWVNYKMECYQDSVIKHYNLYESLDGATYFYPSDIIDPGFYPGWKGDTVVVERRIPSTEGFYQWKLGRLDHTPLFVQKRCNYD